jgi:ATP-dependent Clp protease ATP-binding subunit ClpA
MSMFERFSREARSVVVRAREAAKERGDASIGCEHLLIGLADVGEEHLSAEQVTAASLEAALASAPGSPDGDAQALRAIGIDLDRIRESVDRAFGSRAWAAAAPRPRRSAGVTERLLGRSSRMTPAARKALELGLREAIVEQSREIGTTHLLRGVLRSPGAVIPTIVPEATLARLRQTTRRAA